LLTRVRLYPLLFIATLILIVTAGCSMRTANAAVEKDLALRSRQFNGATANLGQMYLDGQGPYNLPHNTRVLSGVHSVRFIPPVGFYCAAIEVATPTDVYLLFVFKSDPTSSGNLEGGGSWDMSEDDPTVTAIYQKIGLPAYVGGVVLPTSSLTVFAPYLAVIGVVATVAVAVKKRRN